MKPRNWRKFYGYRPQSLAELGRLSDYERERQAEDYVKWLAKARLWSEKKARAYIAAMPRATLVSSSHEVETTAREERHFAMNVSVRTVRCFSARKQLHYGWGNNVTLGWHPLPVRPDAPTTYAVMWDGVCVERFLTKAKAVELASLIANSPAE